MGSGGRGGREDDKDESDRESGLSSDGAESDEDEIEMDQGDKSSPIRVHSIYKEEEPCPRLPSKAIEQLIFNSQP